MITPSQIRSGIFEISVCLSLPWSVRTRTGRGVTGMLDVEYVTCHVAHPRITTMTPSRPPKAGIRIIFGTSFFHPRLDCLCRLCGPGGGWRQKQVREIRASPEADQGGHQFAGGKVADCEGSQKVEYGAAVCQTAHGAGRNSTPSYAVVINEKIL